VAELQTVAQGAGDRQRAIIAAVRAAGDDWCAIFAELARRREAVDQRAAELARLCEMTGQALPPIPAIPTRP
jgi:hypothetical protein